MRRYLLILCLLTIAGVAFSQEVPPFVYYNNLNKQTEFPKNLQSARSVVVLNVAEDKVEFARQIHEKLRLMSLDVILYIDYTDLSAGVDATGPILADLNKREVKYVITFSNNSAGQYEMNITGMGNFLKTGQQKSASFASINIDDLLKYVANELIKAELTKTNFLIIETPEFLTDAKVINGRKFEVHARDIATLKLAVPKFQKVSQEVIDASSDKAIIIKHNQQVDQWNAELANVMKSFPYEYELVDTSDDKELYRLGFQYALFNLNTKGITIKRMLNMAVDESETDFISHVKNDALKRIGVNEVVTKYYIKQLYTNDIYTGDHWDADTSWQESLQNYFYNYQVFVKVR
ncbi:MAG: hypothetical protein AAFQ94_13980 [Bacteroidota bacterium]